jgi:RNA polymerase sigma-70 factor (ECF subfamily)
VTSDDDRSGGPEATRPHRTDEELLAAARGGDAGAYGEVADRHAGRLFRLAFRLVSGTSDAEDVVQETLLAGLRQAGKFRGDASVKTWLTGILVRQAARHHRRRARRKAAPVEDDGFTGGGGGLRPGGSVAESAHRRMDVQRALAALSPLHREVVVLREFEGMSYAEIAEAVGVPRGTVESRLHRARQELRVLLRDYLPGSEPGGGVG